MIDSVKGAFDCIITRGMEVVYPGRQSSSIWLNRGTVVDLGIGTNWRGDYTWLKIQKTGSTSSWNNKSSRTVTITSVEKVVPFHR